MASTLAEWCLILGIQSRRQRDPHAVFESLDVDGNGRLGEREIREFCHQLGVCLMLSSFDSVRCCEVLPCGLKCSAFDAGFPPGRALDPQTVSDTLHEMDAVRSV